MKCIIKALSETEFKPRKRWWGYVDVNGFRHLMRYGCRIAVFCGRTGTILQTPDACTRTDKAGIEFAILHLQKTFKDNEQRVQ